MTESEKRILQVKRLTPSTTSSEQCGIWINKLQDADRTDEIRAEGMSIPACRETPEVATLRRMWTAMGCVHNPDDFKPSVRDTMWRQVEDHLRQRDLEDRRIYRENQSLSAEVESLRARIEAAEAERDAALAVIDEIRDQARDGLEYFGDEAEDYSMSGLWVFETASRARAAEEGEK